MISTDWVTLAVAGLGAGLSFCVWVTVTLFKHNQEIALIKQEIKIMSEVKDVLEKLKDELTRRE